MAAKEDVSKPFEEDAGEILQLCDESNDEGHGEATYEFDVDEMKSQLGIDDIVKSVAALTELVKKVDNSAHTEVGLKRAKLVAGGSISIGAHPKGQTRHKSVGNLLLRTLKRQGLDASAVYLWGNRSFGPPVSDMIANTVNANCVTKPLEDKVKEIQSRYQTQETVNSLSP